MKKNDLKYITLDDGGGLVEFEAAAQELEAYKIIMTHRENPCVVLSCPPQMGFKGNVLWRPAQLQKRSAESLPPETQPIVSTSVQ